MVTGATAQCQPRCWRMLQGEKEALEAEVARYEEAVREAVGAVQRQRAEATALAAGIAGAEKARGLDPCMCHCRWLVEYSAAARGGCTCDQTASRTSALCILCCTKRTAHLRHDTAACPQADDALTQAGTHFQQICHRASPPACVTADECSILRDSGQGTDPHWMAPQDTAERQKEADAAVGERDRLSALLNRRNEELARATEKARGSALLYPRIAHLALCYWPSL